MAEFLVQRLYATLRIGADLRTVHGNSRGQPALLQQGSLDSACGLYSSIMALSLLGHLRYAVGSGASASRKRILKRLALASPSAFLEGMTDEEFEELVEGSGFRVYVARVNGSTGRCVAHAVRALNKGKLALLGVSSPSERFVHATLAVGIEGRQRGRRFTAETLLCLDPNAQAWPYCGFNARLALKASRPGGPYLRYSSSSTPRLSVAVWSSIVLWSK